MFKEYWHCLPFLLNTNEFALNRSFNPSDALQMLQIIFSFANMLRNCNSSNSEFSAACEIA